MNNCFACGHPKNQHDSIMGCTHTDELEDLCECREWKDIPENVKRILNLIHIGSIEANAKSLATQLVEYDFLYITTSEAKQLDEIEKKFHDLVHQITERRV